MSETIPLMGDIRTNQDSNLAHHCAKSEYRMPPMQEEKYRLEKLKLPELRDLCAEQDIDASGTRAVLIERLLACSISESTAPSEKSEKGKEIAPQGGIEDKCGVIVVATTEIGDEPVMIAAGRKALEEVLKNDALYVEYNPTIVRNQGALSFFSLPRDMAIVKHELASTKTELVETKMTVETLGRRVISLEGRVQDLTISLPAYKKIRHRFIDTYVCSTAPGSSAHGRRQIQEGNAAAHGANAKTDAELYREGKPHSDIAIFEQLYGFLPQVVWTLSKQSLPLVRS